MEWRVQVASERTQLTPNCPNKTPLLAGFKEMEDYELAQRPWRLGQEGNRERQEVAKKTPQSTP